MKLDLNDFRISEGKSVKLKQWPTAVKPLYDSKKNYKVKLDAHVEGISELQNLLYAHNRFALLVIFQAMDAAGKDSTIKHVFSGVNPQGCQVHSFKQPSLEELEHDFLWRAIGRLPERGRIGVFNRSYYEEVLVVHVHPELLQNQNLPENTTDLKKLWKQRYKSIVDMEKHLHRNGTHIVKIYLHLSQDEQRKRFLARIDEPSKNWKFSIADIEERKRWDEYMTAYEAALSATSTDFAPWYVVPADDKVNARLIVSRIILETLKDLPMHYPVPDETHLKNLQRCRIQLQK